MSIKYYNTYAKQLIETYDSIDPEELHEHWLSFILNDGMKNEDEKYALDIGAGTGRDVAYLRRNSWGATGIEPCEDFQIHSILKYGVQMIDDQLPLIEKIDSRFDLVLLNGVWMHLSTKDRIGTLWRMSEIVKDNRYLVINTKEISIKNVNSIEEYKSRGMYPCNLNKMHDMATKLGFKRVYQSIKKDVLGRNFIWTTSIFKLAEKGNE